MLNTLKIRIVLCITFLAILFANQASAETDASKQLHGLLKNMRSFQADFTQDVLTNQGVLQQSTQGKMAVKRPGLFYWQTFEPFEQTVVADGKNLWSYDPDLEQVTVQPVGQRLTDTPALLFSGEVDGLTDNYAVSSEKLEVGSRQFRLVPKHPDSLFEELRLTFWKGTLVQMHILDSLDNRSSFRFKNIRINRTLAASLFRFTPPKGVDVITQ